jgi:tRNA 2-thiocytidine biosynthesis protein TtcA
MSETKKPLNPLKKLRKRLHTDVWNAMQDFNMIENGDKVMVCVSGGKDSYTLLDCLLHFKNYSDIDFEILAVNLDQKQPGFPEETLPKYLTELNVPFDIVEKDTYSIVKEKVPEGKTTCSLCSRLRRGVLYTTAKNHGCNKVALGHHRDDIIETFMLNLFFAGKMEAMPPKYITNDSAHIVIRPMAYCKESEIAEFSKLRNHPIIPCNLCGAQPNLQRQMMKELLTNWEKRYPNRRAIMFNALRNVSPTHLLDKDIHDFSDLEKMLDNALITNDEHLPI